MARFIISNCAICNNPIEHGVKTELANRGSHGIAGTAYVCHACAEAEAKARKTRNKAERGAAMEHELEYRFTIPCEYSLRARAEFANTRSKWLAVDGALKSPKYANMMWQRKLETLDHLIEDGDIVLTGEVSVSVLHGSKVLECTSVAYEGKAEFLGFIRHLVGIHKADIYFAKYGKTFGYENQ